MNNKYDVIIIGAGISGVGMACQLKRQHPNKSFLVLERRANVGGTWDLFRYPGIRSDSDMLTFGYKFRPWLGDTILAEGGDIKNYIADTVEDFNLTENICFNTKVKAADWSSTENQWTITIQEEGSEQTNVVTCQYLVSAAGYYNHDQGHLPEFSGRDNFKGDFVHPQKWPQDLDYSNKKVVVIGSGATAITLIPAMAEDVEHITMLQRSPTYIFSVPGKDKVGIVLRKFLPDSWVYRLSRFRNIKLQSSIFRACRRFPDFMKRFFIGRVEKSLAGSTDIGNFTPSYAPWDQRLAAVPDDNLFNAIRSGKASVVTDHIETLTEKGIQLKSGQHLDADIIVSATGLKLQILGGMSVTIDGKAQSFSDKLAYKGVLIEGVPNFAYLFGYTNASWTLKIDMAADYVCRLLTEMDKHQHQVVTPIANDGEHQQDSILCSLTASYVKRDKAVFLRQGKSNNWHVHHSFEKDKKMYQQPLADPALKYQ